jgi:hypothetical protein
MKLRTVLVIQEPRERIPEYIVLKLVALDRLASADLGAPSRRDKCRWRTPPTPRRLSGGTWAARTLRHSPSELRGSILERHRDI